MIHRPCLFSRKIGVHDRHRLSQSTKNFLRRISQLVLSRRFPTLFQVLVLLRESRVSLGHSFTLAVWHHSGLNSGCNRNDRSKLQIEREGFMSTIQLASGRPTIFNHCKEVGHLQVLSFVILEYLSSLTHYPFFCSKRIAFCFCDIVR